MKRRSYAVFYAAATLVMVLLAVGFVNSQRGGEATGAQPHTFQSAPVLRVRVTDEPQVSRNQDPVLVQLESGTIPENATGITVLTDENCAPDKDGVSHCRNRIQVNTPDGAVEAVLRHHHNMAEEPCLAPGEQLVVVT